MRFNRDGNARDRYRKHQQALRIQDHNLIRDSVTHCIHLANQGTDCALIIDSMEDNTLVSSIVQNLLGKSEIDALSQGGGGFLLKNGAIIRIFTINNAYMVPLLMGQKVQILHVKDGDPRAKKAREVLDL